MSTKYNESTDFRQMPEINAIHIFNKYFEMVPAVTDELKHEVYKLRFQVYCVEMGFENHQEFPEGIEFDEYDSHSSHYLIRHRELGIYMATTRLILPNADNGKKLFPVEIHSQIDNVALLKTMPRPHLAELSRFCISKEFRRRKNDPQLLTTNDAIDSEAIVAQEEKRSSSYMMLALIACAIKMSSENNIHYWYAFMEPALTRIVSALGIHFVEIGSLVNHHGLRQPCVIKIDDLLDGVAKKNLNHWNMLTDKGQVRQQ